MIVPLSDNMRIKGTERCWELQRLRARRGQPTWESFKYFGSFGQAVEAAVQREIRLHPAKTLAEAFEAVSGVVRRYDALIPPEFRLVR